MIPENISIFCNCSTWNDKQNFISKYVLYTLFFKKNTKFFHALIVLKCSRFVPQIVLKLFLSVKGVDWSGNEMNIFKSLLMSYLITKQIKRGPEVISIVLIVQTLV